jgi:hypothetical protein
MMNCLVDQNAAIADALQKTAVSSQELEQAVNGAIVGMQFQDRVMQRIHNVKGAMVVLSRAASSIAEQSPHSPVSSQVEEALLRDVLSTFSLGEMRDRFVAAVQLDGISMPVPVPANAAPATSDIELF